ncbi:RNA polymerase sigma-70 factor [Paenibacillus sp. YSY-4.3]
METEQLYLTYRPLLFSMAYRMLGSVMDAEDIVQEAFLAMNRLPSDANIRNVRAYLCKAVTNRCLNLLQSSAKQREVYMGTWLPEPLVEIEGAHGDPSEIVQQKETISTAYLLLLQQLSAMERAVFLLREIFQYPYDEIADIVGKSSFNCRQIFHRAKRSISHEPLNSEASSVSEAQVRNFIQALLAGDTERLLQLLSPDAVHYTDGGGKAHAALQPVVGVSRVIPFYSQWINWFRRSDSDYSYTIETVNGSPGIVTRISGCIAYVYSFGSSAGRIQTVYAVANPDKLKHLEGMIG